MTITAATQKSKALNPANDCLSRDLTFLLCSCFKMTHTHTNVHFVAIFVGATPLSRMFSAFITEASRPNEQVFLNFHWMKRNLGPFWSLRPAAFPFCGRTCLIRNLATPVTTLKPCAPSYPPSNFRKLSTALQKRLSSPTRKCEQEPVIGNTVAASLFKR